MTTPVRELAMTVVLAAAVAFGGGVPAGPAKAQDAAEPPAMVKVDAVRREPLVETVPLIGRFVTRESGVVAARINGPVAEVRVHVGDRVKRGDVLATIVSDTLEAWTELRSAEVARETARIRAAEAEAHMNRQELSRLEGLRKSGSAAFPKARFEDMGQSVQISLGSLAEARARLKEAQANLRLTEIDIGYATIRAPYDGVVTLRHTAAGAYLEVGAPVVTLIGDRDLEIEADVPTNRVGALRLGTEVGFALVDGRDGTARVRAVVPEENPLTRTRPVRFTPRLDSAGLDGPPIDGYAGLAANQSLTLLLPTAAPREVVTVHKDAIIQSQGRDLVYVVVDGTAVSRPVKLGVAVGGRFEVVDGLVPGDRVVVRGNERLRPGQPVEIDEAGQ